MSDMTSAIASGLKSVMDEYNAVAHNLANCNTSGYKRHVTTFSAEMQSVMDGTYSPLAGSIESNDWVDFRQGQLSQTGRSLDVAIEGNGFLALETPEGNLYTRNGSLQINILGQLTDMNGHLIAGKSGVVTIPRTVSDSDIRIESSGKIRAGQIELDELKIVEFEKPNTDLEVVGNGCYRARDGARPESAKESLVRQGWQERSNVQTVGELTNLLGISRVFEANLDFLKKQRESSNALLDIAKS